jgi:hypothetical protein
LIERGCRKQDLPRALAPLLQRQAIELREESFQDDVTRLIEAIDKFLDENSSEFPPGWMSETDQQDSEERTCMYPVGSISASKEPKVWSKGRLIMTIIVGSVVTLLLASIGAFKTPNDIIQLLKSEKTIQMLKNIEQNLPKIIRKLPRIP